MARWAYLLEENDEFRRWYNNLAMGSKVTAKERARVLYRFVVKKGLTVDGLVEMGVGNVRDVEDMLMDFVAELHGEGKSPGYIENYLKAVKSWLQFNSVPLVRKIKIGNRGATPTLDDERVPTPDELLQVLGYAGVRGRCSIALMSLSGVRPEVLGNVDGSDGLELRDFPEMVVEGGRVSFLSVPMIFRVRASLSKAKHRYFTFVGVEGCDYLKAYLEQRMALGEVLDGRSAVIAVKRGHESRGFRNGDRVGGLHVATKTVTKEIRGAMRPRFMWRPYVLRAYFDTMMMLSESRGLVLRDYRAFWMGHKGDIEARYTVNKGLLPDAVLEDMRRMFRDSEEYLTTRKARDVEDVRKKQFLLTAEMLFPDKLEEIRNILGRYKVFSEATDEIQELIRPNNREARTVSSEEEMVELVSQGWDLVRELNGSKFLLKRG